MSVESTPSVCTPSATRSSKPWESASAASGSPPPRWCKDREKEKSQRDWVGWGNGDQCPMQEDKTNVTSLKKEGKGKVNRDGGLHCI